MLEGNWFLEGEAVSLRPMTAAHVGPLTALFAVPGVAMWWPGENEPA